jgi:ferritin-like protein
MQVFASSPGLGSLATRQASFMLAPNSSVTQCLPWCVTWQTWRVTGMVWFLDTVSRINAAGHVDSPECGICRCQGAWQWAASAFYGVLTGPAIKFIVNLEKSYYYLIINIIINKNNPVYAPVFINAGGWVRVAVPIARASPGNQQERIMANEGYHEPVGELDDETRDMHRAITSLMEELEAVDWYNQRVNACDDAELKAILAHNRDEEKEHAAMVLEWIRRRDPAFDKELRDYLFTDKPIVHA